MVFTTIERSTGLQIVLNGIRTAILKNKFPPGFQLKQSVIATEFGISQGLVREALARLIEEGLAENIPYRGTFVRKLTEKDIQEIYQVRTILECLAMELTLPKFREDENLQKLDFIHQRTLEAIKGGDPDVISNADLEFHRFIVDLSGNSRLISIWESLVAQYRYLLRNLYAAQIHMNASNHTDWLEAIRNKEDAGVITKLISARMKLTENTMLEHWRHLQVAEETERN